MTRLPQKDIALHNLCGIIAAMDSNERESLVAYIRALGIDNFTLAGDILMLGARRSRVRRCRCDRPGCDGWSLQPITHPTAAAPNGSLK